MENISISERSHTIHLIHEETRYRGGYEATTGTSKVERLEIILYPDGSFSHTHRVNGCNETSPVMRTGEWELDSSDAMACIMVLKFNDGIMQSFNIKKTDDNFIFLDSKRFRINKPEAVEVRVYPWSFSIMHK